MNSRLRWRSSTRSVDVPGQQINSSQQAERAMTPIPKIASKGRIEAWHGWQIRRRRRDSLDPRLFVVGDDRHRLARFLGRGCGLFQDLKLAIDTQNLGHFLLELGVAAFQIVAQLVRLDVLPAEKLAHRALSQTGETFMSGLRSVLARMAGQQSRRPHLMRIAMVLGLVARQRHQPGLGFRRDHRLLTRSRAVVERRQCAISHRPLDAALDRLMMGASLWPTAKNDGFWW